MMDSSKVLIPAGRHAPPVASPKHLPSLATALEFSKLVIDTKDKHYGGSYSNGIESSLELT
jgi:hypothetical protein